MGLETRSERVSKSIRFALTATMSLPWPKAEHLTSPLGLSTHESIMTTGYGDPESYFVFLVGNSEEWVENRVEQGDIALFNEYLALGVPPSQLCFVKDNQECTNTNCQNRLEQFLRTTRPQSTLVFYYGGHGQSTAFGTRMAPWTYQQVCKTIDDQFQGERVLFLLDCCASGNLARWLGPPFHVTKEYISIANSPPFVRASFTEGDEWVLSNSFLRGMRSNGNGIVRLEQVMDFLTDRTALVLRDQATIFVGDGVDCTRTDWIPRRRQQQDVPSDSIEWSRLNENIPKEAIVSSRWGIGNCVFYKHPGGVCEPNSRYLPPGWYNAKIAGETYLDDGCAVDLLVECTVTGVKWTVKVPRNQLMNDSYMGQMWMIPGGCEDTLEQLARNFKYLDFSIPSDTIVSVVDSDGGLRSGRVLDWRYFDFERYLDSGGCSRDPPYGAHVAIEWCDDDETATLIPAYNISFPTFDLPPFSPSIDDVNGMEEMWSRKAMLMSIESSGKVVCNANEMMGSKFEAFWPGNEEWYDVEPLDPDTVSLKILSSHIQFIPKGAYCPLWYEDGERHLSPAVYVKLRR